MTVRDELVAMIREGDKVMPLTVYWFLRDHGPALVEALKDADRWNEWCRQVDEADGEQRAKTNVEMILIDGIHLGSGCLELHVDQAIDRARGGE